LLQHITSEKMGDSTPSRSRGWDDEDENDECKRLLYGQEDLRLDDYSIEWILKHIDCFVRHSRGNESIGSVYLWPHAINGHDDEIWDKVGQAIGNLQALERLHICNSHAIFVEQQRTH
jgi:hypothetical protein